MPFFASKLNSVNAGITILKSDSLICWHEDVSNTTKVLIGNFSNKKYQAFYLDGDIKDVLFFKNSLYVNLLYHDLNFYNFQLLKDSDISLSTKIDIKSNIFKVNLNNDVQLLNDGINCGNAPTIVRGFGDFSENLNLLNKNICHYNYLKVNFNPYKKRCRLLITDIKGNILFDSKKKKGKTSFKLLLSGINNLNIKISCKVKKSEWSTSCVFE